jgi:hypothetical protein
MATTTSKIAKRFKAATSTSEEPPSPEDGARKRPPEELVEAEKPNGKVTTLWQRGKLKRLVIVDVPKGKDTGPPPDENGVSFCKQFNVKCVCPSSTPRNPCCERETHASLNNIGEYDVFPAQTLHRGFFSAVNKIVVQAQLFCRYSNSAKLPRVNRSATSKISFQTRTMLVSSEQSKSILMDWDADYPNNKFKPPHD